MVVEGTRMVTGRKKCPHQIFQENHSPEYPESKESNHVSKSWPTSRAAFFFNSEGKKSRHHRRDFHRPPLLKSFESARNADRLFLYSTKRSHQSGKHIHPSIVLRKPTKFWMEIDKQAYFGYLAMSNHSKLVDGNGDVQSFFYLKDLGGSHHPIIQKAWLFSGTVGIGPPTPKRLAFSICVRLLTLLTLNFDYLEDGPPGLGYVPGTPRPTIYKWMFQLDDAPNLYIENGWKSPNIHL